MYFSKKTMLYAFTQLQKVDENETGKARQEKVSALRHTLAISQLLKQTNQTEFDLAVSVPANRDAFKAAVSDIVSINRIGRFTVDFYKKFDTDSNISVSSNFLTTIVQKSRNANATYSYPGRHGSLLNLLREKVSIHDDLATSLRDGYGFSDIKLPLIFWLLRKNDLDHAVDLSIEINKAIKSRFETKFSGVLRVTPSEIESFLSSISSDKSLLWGDSPCDTSFLEVEAQSIEHSSHANVELVGLIDIAIDATSSCGLCIDKGLLCRFFASLLAKRFCIFTGLAGSGKTKLAEALAWWICDSKHQYALVAVGADWTSNESLLGYADALQIGSYAAPSNGVLDLLIRASSNQSKPYFLILDEMNLSHVERYFADFLSSIESSSSKLALHGKDTLQAGTTAVPAQLALPENLFIIGTVNVDETTYMFSPKVLDRANVIEFRADKEQMTAFLDAPNAVNLDALKADGVAFADAFVSRSKADASLENLNDADGNPIGPRLKSDLLEVFETLASIGAEFGFRTAKEIARFVVIHQELSGDDWQYKDALDAQVLQKLMPKLHGSARKLGGVLNALEIFANKHELTLTLEKVQRMQVRLKRDGFTSFAEN
jgi:hypothetical protein